MRGWFHDASPGAVSRGLGAFSFGESDEGGWKGKVDSIRGGGAEGGLVRLGGLVVDRYNQFVC